VPRVDVGTDANRCIFLEDFHGIGHCACIVVANSDFGVTSSAFLFLLSMSLQGQLESPASRTQSKGSMARSCTPQRGDARPFTPRTPKRGRKAPTTPPGIGAAAHDASAALSRFLKRPNQSIAELRKLLISDPAAAILPLDGQPVLIYAMRHKSSLEVLRTLLAHGAQPEQVDPQGRNSLSALSAMSLPFTDGGLFVNADSYRPCAMLSRLHVSYAVELLNAGVQPVVEDVGKGNEACAACIREYKDALASVVIRRWIGGDGATDWLCLVADYIYCK
jgi:hypothetical protein